MSDERAMSVRQWVSLPGGSCDVRMGTKVIDEASPVLKGAVGKPRAALLVVEDGLGESLAGRVKMQLTDAGFAVDQAAMARGAAARCVEGLTKLLGDMAAACLTADDLVVAIGDTDALSLASLACAQWCGGIPLVMVPTSVSALVEAPVTPRGIDVGDREAILSLRPSVKYVLADFNEILHEELDESMLMARVLMVVTAMCDSETAFSRLWDNAEDLCANDMDALCNQLRDTVKLRGKICSSTALALRQSLGYGSSFAKALQRLLGDDVAPSTARAEALRFQARLSAGQGNFEVDDVLAQDELLEQLGLPVIHASVDPQQLIDAVREERYMRSNRFLLGLPRKLGRVRLTTVDDELIYEHVAAWCASRSA